MKIQLHIERLVLDGAPLDRLGAARVQAAVEAELGRLLQTGPLPPGLAGGGAVPSLAVPRINLPNAATPGQWGAAIAGSLHGGLSE